MATRFAEMGAILDHALAEMREMREADGRIFTRIDLHEAIKVIHAILDNCATHKHPAVMKWLAEHPRWTFHFTPTSASWLNAVEGFFSTITRRKIRRGVFKSVPQLEDEIARYIKDHNKSAQPFVWTKPSKAIFEKLAAVTAPSV